MRYPLLLTSFLLISPSCQLIEKLGGELGIKPPKPPSGSSQIKLPPIGTGEQLFAAKPVEPEQLSEANGWTLASTAADVQSINGGKGRASAMVFHDFTMPSSLAVASLAGSRWDVTFAGKTYHGFDTIHAYPATEKRAGRGFAFSKTGDHFAFLASRNGKTSYFVDGVAQPSFGDDKKAFGPLIFSDDGAAYAYQVGNSTLVVNGKERIDVPDVERAHGARDAISEVGFAEGTHDLHYVRQFRAKGMRHASHLIVSGSKSLQPESTLGLVQPRFFRDGTPYWYLREPNQSTRGMLVVDGKQIGVAGIARSGSQNVAPTSPELLARLEDKTSRATVGIFVWHNGKGTVHAVPESLHTAHQVGDVVASQDCANVMYVANKVGNRGSGSRLVVDQVISPIYEAVRMLGFTAGGHGIALARQGGRSFLLLDGRELEKAYNWNGMPRAEFARQGNRFLLTVGKALLLGEVRDADIVFEDWRPQDKESFRHVVLSDDGSKLLWQSSLPIKRGSQDQKHSIMVNGEPVATTTGGRKSNAFISNGSGSVVLWPVPMKGSNNTNLSINNREVGSIYRLTHPRFGDGDNFAFTTNRAVKPKQPAPYDPMICVNGRFFEGLRPLHPGGWSGNTFYVIGYRGEGANGEVVLASYQAN